MDAPSPLKVNASDTTLIHVNATNLVLALFCHICLQNQRTSGLYDVRNLDNEGLNCVD